MLIPNFCEPKKQNKKSDILLRVMLLDQVVIQLKERKKKKHACVCVCMRRKKNKNSAKK